MGIGILFLIGLVTLFVFVNENTNNAKIETKTQTKTTLNATENKTIILAGGCFWCVESDLEKLPGVQNVVSGYSGGESISPTYENYTQGGHREVVEVSYDPKLINLADIIDYFLKHFDPTDATGSFGDRGLQYSSAIYYEDETEKLIAQDSLTKLEKLNIFDKPLAVQVLPREKFWPAEEYHQDYSAKNPIRYKFYRDGSGRDAFIKKYWSD